MKKQLRYLSAALMFAGAMQTGFAMEDEKPTWKVFQETRSKVEKALPGIKEAVGKLRVGQQQKVAEFNSRLFQATGVSADELQLYSQIDSEEAFNRMLGSKSHDDSSSILDKSPLLNLGKKNLLSVDDAGEKLAQAILRIQELEKENQKLLSVKPVVSGGVKQEDVDSVLKQIQKLNVDLAEAERQRDEYYDENEENKLIIAKLGSTHVELAEHEKATKKVEDLEKELVVAKGIVDNLGSTHVELAEHKKATKKVEDLEKELVVAKGIVDNLGPTHVELAEHEKATKKVEDLEKELVVAKGIVDNLGSTHVELEEHKKATKKVEDLEKELVVAKGIVDNLGSTHVELEEHKKLLKLASISPEKALENEHKGKLSEIEGQLLAATQEKDAADKVKSRDPVNQSGPEMSIRSKINNVKVSEDLCDTLGVGKAATTYPSGKNKGQLNDKANLETNIGACAKKMAELGISSLDDLKAYDTEKEDLLKRQKKAATDVKALTELVRLHKLTPVQVAQEAEDAGRKSDTGDIAKDLQANIEVLVQIALSK